MSMGPVVGARLPGGERWVKKSAGMGEEGAEATRAGRVKRRRQSIMKGHC